MSPLDSPLFWIIVGAIVIVAIAVIAVMVKRRPGRHHARLRERYGPEYERLVQQYGSDKDAERELVARERRVRRFRLRELSDAEHERFATAWREVQVRFVDEPREAVLQANDLVKELMGARGYPVEDFEQRVADLSVEHANVVQHYRAARALTEANRATQGDTEELRQAFVHYRALFSELLEQKAGPARNLQEVHA